MNATLRVARLSTAPPRLEHITSHERVPSTTADSQMQTETKSKAEDL